MAKAETNVQGQLTDVKLADVDGKIADTIQVRMDNKDAVSAYRKATEELKKLLPDVDQPTRFIIGESFIVTVSPYEAEGFEIPGGMRKRMKIEAQE